MPVRTPTQWTPPSGKGYISGSSGALITSQSGIGITSQSGVSLIINPEVYQPKFATSWAITSKNKSSWKPGSGSGYVINIGNENIITNNSLFIVTNDGKQIVTTPTYDIPKNATSWIASGA